MLPRIAIQRPDRVIGKDTVTNMQSGVFWGYVALIEGMVARIKAEWGKPMTVIGTGGVARLNRPVRSGPDYPRPAGNLAAEHPLKDL
jgi:pantothenate kinase type III